MRLRCWLKEAAASLLKEEKSSFVIKVLERLI